MRIVPLPSQEYLHEILNYQPETGRFFWRRTVAKAKAGQEAFLCGTRLGHRRAQIDGQKYFAHRVAWKYIYGTEPLIIDHIDGDPTNNAISNLRSVDQSGNQRNRSLSPKSKTGVVGVTPFRDKFRADIRVNQRHIYLGVFGTIEEASRARAAASDIHGFHPNHGR